MLKEEIAERHKMRSALDALVETVVQVQASVNALAHGLPPPGPAHQVDLHGTGPSAPTSLPSDGAVSRPAAPGNENPSGRSAAPSHHGARAGFPICPVECIEKHEDGYVPNGVAVSPRVQLQHERN